MKKILTYTLTVLAAVAALASCDKNDYPVFDDKNAFVAFDETSVSVDEDYSNDGKVIRIPVTLASVAGLQETVKFEVIEPETKAAKAGVNYELVTTSGTLSFDAEHRTAYIEFKTIYFDEYTGDLKFSIKVYGNDNVATGSEDECTVTIGDIDHPLSFMLGTYTVTGEDNWDGVTSWTMTISKDESDEHKVWIRNLANYNNAKVIAYGIVSDDHTKLNIPFGQEFEASYDGVSKLPLWGVTAEGKLTDTGSVDVNIVTDGSKVTLDFGQDYGFAIPAISGGSPAGYFAIIWPGVTAVKN